MQKWEYLWVSFQPAHPSGVSTTVFFNWEPGLEDKPPGGVRVSTFHDLGEQGWELSVTNSDMTAFLFKRPIES